MLLKNPFEPYSGAIKHSYYLSLDSLFTLTLNPPAQSRRTCCHSHFPACCSASRTSRPRRKRDHRENPILQCYRSNSSTMSQNLHCSVCCANFKLEYKHVRVMQATAVSQYSCEARARHNTFTAFVKILVEQMYEFRSFPPVSVIELLKEGLCLHLRLFASL